ncbi:TonB-linked SusC/RagA family outer membrane protein [Larkinella arboricola]|uniref:TonB-linked SusC/RagA family outer membrane protein n=1 Tax=Larkinella arboricola TaxID=643671 RepID=A0A327X5I4_LARAB|nr:TonB-dependent receptor [Larkinella arboricola]RAK01919.1 TonB-linked SusC/RagA family outer membrane protein [Larkinella arboricola]
MERSIRLLILLLLMATTTWAQQRVSGRVTDSEGTGLPGVSVQIKNTTNGANTDANGQYSIEANQGDVLVFSFIGMKTAERTVSGSSLDIQLEEDVTTLTEVVAVGYGVQRKADVTGSISSVKAQDIASRPVASATQALQGKAAGVLITTNQGLPGAAPNVRIRGVGTVGNSNPLYVVDGMFVDDIRFLNPSDIQTIDVLKDASSLAIYGVRGANGVVLITTKGGKSGRTAFNYEGYAGVTQLSKKLEMTNASEFATLVNEVAVNEGGQPKFPNPGSLGAGTDWFDYIFRTGSIQNHQITASGGNERVTFNVSGSYYDEKGIVQQSAYNRLTFRVNNTYKLTSNFRLGNNLAFSRSQSNNIPSGIVQTAYNADPTITPRNANGSYGFSSVSTVANPAATLAYQTDDIVKSGQLVGNIYGELDFLKSFTLRSSFGVDLGLNNTRIYLPQYFVSASQRNDQSKLTREYGLNTTWLWENTLTFNRTFGKIHNINALLGATAQNTRADFLQGIRFNVPGYSNDVKFLSLGSTVGAQTTDVPSYEFTYASYLFRVNYSLLDRYLLTVSLRRDGSSRFPPESRWATFPAVGLGWRIIDESFMKDQQLFSNLKLRASYGKLGNTNIPNYLYYSRISSGQNAIFGPGQAIQQGATLESTTTSNLLWETVTQTDIGLEMGFLNNRLTAEIDYYNRQTSDMILNVNIGNGRQVQANAASAYNRGFELTAGWNDNVGDLKYSLNANLTTVQNEVTNLGNGGIPIIGGSLGNGRTATLTDVGRPIGAFYGYRMAGVFQTADEVRGSAQPNAKPGDLRYEDVNGDGVINGDDRVFLGTPIPKMFWGFNTNFSFKGFDLGVDFQGSHGNKIYNGRRAVRFGNENYERIALERWTPQNPSNTQPRLTNGGPNYDVSDYFIESGSFVRIRNIQIGYTLPSTLLSSIGIRSIRAYVNALNPVTFTNYSGFSPEVGGNEGATLSRGVDLDVVPVYRTTTVGLQIGF